jgi:putative peptidoglycan lipid II flippase
LNYAFRLMYLPIGLFGISIATATLPVVSRDAARLDRAAVRRTMADGLSLMMMLNVPATIGLIALSTPIVRAIFERGAFTAADTAATAAALQFYAAGLVGYSVVRIATPAFYAIGRNRTPVAVSVATVAVNAALNIMLVRSMGYRGLALGTSLAALFNAGFLWLLLRRHLSGLEDRRVLSSFARILSASLVMGAVVVSIDAWLIVWLPGESLPLQLIRLSAAIGAGVATLAVAAYLLRVQEFQAGIAMVAKRFGGPTP